MPVKRMFLGLGALLIALPLNSCPVDEAPELPQAGGFGKAASLDLVKSEPLAEPQAGEGFTKIDAAESGLDFDNAFMDEMLLTYTLLQQSGVAAGDYDSDGDVDLYVTGLDAHNKLYRNEGGLKFTDVTEGSGKDLGVAGKYCCGAVFADLVGDGSLDLLVAVRNGSDKLFIGDGKGGFKEDGLRRGLGDEDDSTVQFAVFDADRDGDLDIYEGCHQDFFDRGISDLASRQASAGSKEIPEEMLDKFYMDPYGRPRQKPDADKFYLNDGKGYFEDATSEAGLNYLSFTNGVLATDLNDDGWTDLFVSADFATPDRMMLNKQDGTFEDVAKTHLRKTVLSGMSVDYGDLNNDGRQDLFAGDMLAKDGKRAKRQSGDMNQWRKELLYDQPQPQMRNMMYLNRGDGWYSEAGQMAGLASSDWTWTCRIVDFDCNGNNEVFTTTGIIRDIMDVDAAAGMGFINSSTDPKAELAYMQQMEDFNSINYIFTRVEDKLKYTQAPGNWGVDESKMSCGATLADLDGDGDRDMVINNTDDVMSLYRNDFGSGNRAILELRQPKAKNPQAVGSRIWAYCGDDVFVQDVILARGFATGEPASILLGLGEHAKIDRLEIRWPDGAAQVQENLDAGMKYTISRDKEVTRWEAPKVDALFATSTVDFQQKEEDTQAKEFLFEPLLPFLQSKYGTGLSVADFNGDDKLDVYFCGATGQTGKLMTGDGAGKFNPDDRPGLLSTASEEMTALALEANGDGATDLLVTSGGCEQTDGHAAYNSGMFFNNKGTLGLGKLPPDCKMNGAAAAADIDGDGDLDMLTCGHMLPHYYGVPKPNQLLVNDGKGAFSNQIAIKAPGLAQVGQINDAQFADINSDGKADLLIAVNWGKVELWLNDGQMLTKSQDLTPRGWWRSMGVGDFDNDGDLDVIASNAGVNTKYSPKPDAPVTMLAADFDISGTRDLVEVKFNADGSTIPSRGRSCSGYAINTIPARFPTWTSFANASLRDVYGDMIDTAERFEADELHSVLLTNNEGKFASSELPGASQWTPVFGVGVGDYNADGKLDAFLATNFTATQPETGAWNSGYGVLLQGHGDGSFTDTDVPQSGIAMYSDGRGVIPADYNGDALLDILISASDGQPHLALANADQVKGSGLLVSLTGPAGNPNGVGARLTLTLDNGTALTREVQAGSGYLSSYSGPVHFGIPEGAKASNLTVRWADGTTSEASEFAGNSVSVAHQ